MDLLDTSLISLKTKEKWALCGSLRLLKYFDKQAFLCKFFSFKHLSNDISLQRKAFIQNTDRCIILSEQLFQAKEAKEKVEFEKEELAAVLESKTEELNKLIDIIEQYKSWQSKLNTIETTLSDEIDYWKSQANAFQCELEKKNKEVIEVYSDKKKAEEECLKAYRNLDLAQRQNIELQKELKSDASSEQGCEKCEKFKIEVSTYEELIEEMKKVEERNLAEIRDLHEQISRPPSSASQKSKPKVGKKPVKRSLEFEKQSISENENQLGMEIVNLNKQVSKLKHEIKTTTELLKKCQQERDELKRLMIGKDEALARVRKENDQLSLSLSTDHYKSVHKLEHASMAHEQKNKELVALVQELQQRLEAENHKVQNLTTEKDSLSEELDEIKQRQKVGEMEKMIENLNNLQNKFIKLKEMSDKQIQTIESLKQDNYQLMQSVESYKAFARSSKLHADKALGDAEAYAGVIKKMEVEVSQLTHAKDIAENEIVILKQHIMKLLGSRA